MGLYCYGSVPQASTYVVYARFCLFEYETQASTYKVHVRDFIYCNMKLRQVPL